MSKKNESWISVANHPNRWHRRLGNRIGGTDHNGAKLVSVRIEKANGEHVRRELKVS